MVRLALMMTASLVTAALAHAGADGGMDAGPGARPPPPERLSWTYLGVESVLDGGYSDALSLRVGETAEVVFPFPIVLMQCDQPLLTLAATQDTLLLTGGTPGRTSCGFWFYERAWPHRFMDVIVLPR
mgnify:FL=1